MPKTMRHRFQTHRLTEHTGQHGPASPSPRTGGEGWGEGVLGRVMFPGDDAAASKTCSDHRPIWSRVPATHDD